MGDDDPWPDAFLAGTQKAATTSLYHYLDQHPEIWMAPEKEPHFFSDYLGSCWTDGEPDPEAREAYLDLFRDAPDVPVVAEASASYLTDRHAPDRIAERVPDARVMASLRDPVERAFSHYLMNVRGGDIDVSLLEWLQERGPDPEAWKEERGLVSRGFYADAMERWIDRFGRDRVHVILLADLKEDPVEVLRGVAEFLGVDPDPMEDVDFDLRFNPYGRARNPLFDWARSSDLVQGLAGALVPLRLRRWIDNTLLLETEEKPELDPEARRILQEGYAEDVERLEEILNRDLPELRASWR